MEEVAVAAALGVSKEQTEAEQVMGRTQMDLDGHIQEHVVVVEAEDIKEEEVVLPVEAE